MFVCMWTCGHVYVCIDLYISHLFIYLHVHGNVGLHKHDWTDVITLHLAFEVFCDTVFLYDMLRKLWASHKRKSIINSHNHDHGIRGASTLNLIAHPHLSKDHSKYMTSRSFLCDVISAIPLTLCLWLLIKDVSVFKIGSKLYCSLLTIAFM